MFSANVAEPRSSLAQADQGSQPAARYRGSADKSHGECRRGTRQRQTCRDFCEVSRSEFSLSSGAWRSRTTQVGHSSHSHLSCDRALTSASRRIRFHFFAASVQVGKSCLTAAGVDDVVILSNFISRCGSLVDCFEDLTAGESPVLYVLIFRGACGERLTDFDHDHQLDDARQHLDSSAFTSHPRNLCNVELTFAFQLMGFGEMLGKVSLRSNVVFFETRRPDHALHAGATALPASQRERPKHDCRIPLAYLRGVAQALRPRKHSRLCFALLPRDSPLDPSPRAPIGTTDATSLSWCGERRSPRLARPGKPFRAARCRGPSSRRGQTRASSILTLSGRCREKNFSTPMSTPSSLLSGTTGAIGELGYLFDRLCVVLTRSIAGRDSLFPGQSSWSWLDTALTDQSSGFAF